MLDDALTARIAAAKRHCLEGGLLQEVEWGVPGEPDIRGRRIFTYSMLDALIEQRPGLDRATIDTGRADNTGADDPRSRRNFGLAHGSGGANRLTSTRSKAVEGLLKNAETGTRYASEITVIR